MAGSSSNNDLLLDLDDHGRNYGNPGRPAIDTNVEYQSRPSVSYDDFVNGNTAGSSAVYSQSVASQLSPATRTYSQTRELGHYQPYYDEADDLGHDSGSRPASGYQYASATDDHSDVGGANRQSAYGGVVGRVKSAFGMNQEYSEMDLPLTEATPIGSSPAPGGAPSTRKRRNSGSKFTFGFGGKKVDPSTLGPRVIHLNNPPANAVNKYVDNHVSTAKYNIATFIPKFLYEQFSKYANLFFLFTAGLQQIPNISPTNRYTTIGPLIVVLIVSAGKELIEDWKRTAFETQRWINVRVGDIVRVESEEPFPADLVLMASSEPEGLCYIETANLDGETNLKIKQAIPETAGFVSPGDLSRLSGRIRSEQPNSSLYTYEATLTIDVGGGEKELPLSPEQLLLRGATLRNTPWVHGVVVFTGHETKLMRNATATPIKRTAVERTLNVQIIMLVSILLILSLVSSTGDVIKQSTASSTMSYLYLENNNRVKQFFADILTYWVLYSNLVPISLFVTVEVVKYYHAFLINSDLDIYYAETDTPAVCRTSSLVEELGQIEYIFSDKTGTLTCNMMEFKQCSIGGICYADEVPEDRRATVQDGVEVGIHDFARLAENLKTHSSREVMHHFLTLLATCHTVIPERKEDKPNEIKYQAASPDEGALVEGAVQLGYRFIARKPRSVAIMVGGKEYEYEMLNICEFNSTRKRMSTVLRCPDGKIRIYCKGADTVIMERLHKDNPMVEATLQHLEDYATEGLRTLCLAMREIPDEEYRQWSAIYDKAATTINNRGEELDKAAELIEKDLYLLGATAIEDKLQDGVPDTIHTLQTAGIKIWVLTGDRQETAINIGMSCKLISEDMTLIIVNEDNMQDTRDSLTKKLNAVKSQKDAGGELEALALVIDGRSLTFALERELEKVFLDLAVMCKAVICCRVSPLQKALVVKLVKRHLKAILLAIGDGANDVSMIQAAHVGVGISGVEGLQAARSADVAIGQFRFLRKLLLVHGAWSYQRISKVILYSFYKNITLYMTQFWFSFQNAFSGQVIYESWTLSFYNVFFTVLPPLVMGIFDQFISARLLDRYPQLYQLGQKGQFFKTSSFWAWLVNGFYHSLILYIFSELIFLYDLPMGDGQTAGHWLWGTALYTAVLATVLGKAALVTNLWTKYTVMAIPGSMLIWMGFMPAYATVAPMLGFSTEYQGILAKLITSPVFWAMVIILPALCLTRDFAWKYAKRMYYPQTYHHIQEIQKYNIQDYRPRMEQFQKAIRKVRQVQRMRKQRGYAFSQADEGQSRLIQAYDTTKERGKYGEMKSVRPEDRPLR
ncbi:uncharacterized protein H6S33_001597 [Morchella sextelata]|uniref:uncharacterized protein n=1 Tax=Morchella sextelata TaxID=1174677 RepID=UPI001D051CDC|nr:uncharacterized protein H6S33_001597 [Morchella sextelata]KAH0608463.1 hypothetical protein H6S33_001597 [Morchella sextelata]